MAENYEVINNEKNLQFEIHIEGEIAKLVYRWHKGNIALMHTYVPEAYEGKGIASTLAKTALEYAKAKDIKVMVYCPYVAKYMTKHPEYEYLKDNKE
jgi:predicted GNAT family acetyltransferase